MEHSWKIYDLKRTLSSGVVTNVAYACESNHNGFGRRKTGEITISGSADDAGFISFDSLSEENVLAWVTGSVNQNTIELENSSSLANTVIQSAAITTGTGLPWDEI